MTKTPLPDRLTRFTRISDRFSLSALGHAAPEAENGLSLQQFLVDNTYALVWSGTSTAHLPIQEGLGKRWINDID
jgi:hypothetical protein